MAVVTGSRAEFGLLAPVMRAVRGHPRLTLQAVVAGAHFLPPAETWREVDAAFGVDARVPMQRPGATGRLADAEALGEGVAACAREFARLQPAWVVVLGDRIEAFAAAAAASVAGIMVAHLHGGDRAEGVADEAMRHAITKLAHLHLPATHESARRIVRMGEDDRRVRVAGSPAMDGLDEVRALGDSEFERLGSPDAVFLMHPIGRGDEEEARDAAASLSGLRGRRVLAMAPNFDPGREGIARAIRDSGVRAADHLSRGVWLSLLRRLADSEPRGVLVGNSSAGLIEAAGLASGGSALAAVNIGPRQAGRERAGNVIEAEAATAEAVEEATRLAAGLDLRGLSHPYGDGRTGARVAAALAETGFTDPAWLRKRNAY